MAKNKTQKPIGKQAQKFIDKARELGCDESEAAFDEKLRRITPKPKSKEKSSDK